MIALWVRTGLELGAWGLASAWCLRAYGAAKHLPLLPNLSQKQWDRIPAATPGLAVVVPARDEAANIAATLESLVAQDYPWLQVIAVNDRSTDSTGAIMDEYAARYPHRVRAVHISSLPEGWLGKTHAMHTAVQESTSKYLLFTDADINFESSILRRVVTYAEEAQAAHVVVAPTPEIRSFGEGVMMGFFQVLGLWAVRPWRVTDPNAKRDAIGVGAFNLVRRDALEAIGGLEPQRMAVIEDAALGIRLKAAGFAQRLAVAPGMVRVHWAAGALGIVRVMTKNLFSGVNFRPSLLLGGCAGLATLFMLPIAGLFWRPTTLPSLIAVACTVWSYRSMRIMTSIPMRYAWAYPAGAAAFVWAMLRSMFVALARRGVVWRGTFYSLRELRKHNSPWKWRKQNFDMRRK